MILSEWARTWNIPAAAMADLAARTGMIGGDLAPPQVAGTSEAAVQSLVRVEASQKGLRMWRNNLGSYEDQNTGRWIRYGLANDSAAVNEICKSADLIGIRPMLIQQGDVGKVFGRFVSIECKRADWKWGNSPRERAQANWLGLVLSLGGEAHFINGGGQI